MSANAEASESDVTATATQRDTYIIGIDEGRLTPLDAYDERLRAGDTWIESDTVREVRQ